MNKCKDCKWWQREESYTGWCKRFPPTHEEGEVLWDEFPRTKNNQWCGEFEAKEVVNEKEREKPKPDLITEEVAEEWKQ